MTTSLAKQAMPLLLRRAAPTAGQAVPRKQHFGAVEEALPVAVERRGDGVIVSRDTYTTEVERETTDDV